MVGTPARRGESLLRTRNYARGSEGRTPVFEPSRSSGHGVSGHKFRESPAAGHRRDSERVRGPGVAGYRVERAVAACYLRLRLSLLLLSAPGRWPPHNSDSRNAGTHEPRFTRHWTSSETIVRLHICLFVWNRVHGPVLLFLLSSVFVAQYMSFLSRTVSIFLASHALRRDEPNHHISGVRETGLLLFHLRRASHCICVCDG